MQPDDPLGMDPEAMRRLGYDVVDRLVARAERMDASPTLRTVSREAIAELLDGPAPEQPQPVERVLDDLFEHVLPFLGRFDHPRFFAYIPGAGTWPAALADLVASAANIDAGEWREAAGPSQVELTVLGWFAEWIGYPSGRRASSSVVARRPTSRASPSPEALAGPMSIGSWSTSVTRRTPRSREALERWVSGPSRSASSRRMSGSDCARQRSPPRWTPNVLKGGCRSRSLRPAARRTRRGRPARGAVGALPRTQRLAACRRCLRRIRRPHRAWTSAAQGLELADSVTLDPHKWLAMPFEVGCLMVREGHQLRSAFEIVPEYLKDSQMVEAEVNLANRGLQLTRGARALKVWVSLKVFGVDAFRRAIDRSLDLAAFAQECIERSEHLEIVTPVTLGVLTFRRRFPGIADEDELERLNTRLIQSLAESGVGLVSSTRLRGMFVIRFCVLNHTSGRQDVQRVLDWLDSADVPIDRDPEPTVERASETGVRQSWLAGSTMTSWDLAAIPLFETLSDDRCLSLLAVSRELRAAPGEVVIREWEYGKLFYVILEGAVEVVSGTG